MLLVLGLTLIPAIKVTKRRLPGTIALYCTLPTETKGWLSLYHQHAWRQSWMFMVVRAHLKITFKDEDGFNLGSWRLGKWMLKHRDHRSVLSWVLYLSSDRYLVLCLSADRYLVLYFIIYVCSAAQHSFLVCQRARRIAIHSIFSPTERVMRW